MADLPRLNGVIRALEAGQHALTCFSPADVKTAVAMRDVEIRRLVFEMEHNPWDIRLCATACNTCSTARQIARAASVAPAVTPMVRIPPNGGEMAQWHAKQILDIGCYGIILPHISTVEQAYNAVAACRYPRLKGASALRAGRHPRRRPDHCGALLGHEPAGILPAGRRLAAQSAGRDFRDFEIEDTEGIKNLKDIFKNVPGIGCILIGEGDLSQELGYPRQYEHKVVLDSMAQSSPPARKPASSSAIRMSRPVTPSASSRKAIAS